MLQADEGSDDRQSRGSKLQVGAGRLPPKLRHNECSPLQRRALLGAGLPLTGFLGIESKFSCDKTCVSCFYRSSNRYSVPKSFFKRPKFIPLSLVSTPPYHLRNRENTDLILVKFKILSTIIHKAIHLDPSVSFFVHLFHNKACMK